MPGRRTRRRSRAGSGTSWTAVVLFLVVLGGIAHGGSIDPVTSAFTSGETSTSGSMEVTVDERGIHALDPSAGVPTGSTAPLVNVTNRLGRDVRVTVAVRNGSAGRLVVDGIDRGDSVTFPLREGVTRQIRILVPDDDSLVGTSVRFDVVARAPGLTASAPNRSVPVEGCRAGCGDDGDDD